MPGPAHPELFAAVGRLHAKGDRRQAQELMAKVMPLIALGKRNMDTFLFVQKYVLIEARRPAGHRPGPAGTGLSIPHLPSEVDELLEELELLELFGRCRDAGRWPGPG